MSERFEPCPQPQTEPIKDAWQHRSELMRCRGCMYYVEKAGGNSRHSTYGQLGRCRKHAPTMNGWPAVFSQDWCGDHKLDENKI